MPRILLVDDNPLDRQSIVEVLTTALPHCTVGEAATAAEGLDAIWNESWNVVLLDLYLPERSGLELLKDIKAARPKLPVVILSSYPASQFATRVLKAGAAGYLTKGSPPETVIRAVRQALAGVKVITASVGEQPAAAFTTSPSTPAHELLTDDEYDVMLRIASGQGVGEIANILNLSIKTVSTHRAQALEKMGLKDNSELTQYAVRHQLIQ